MKHNYRFWLFGLLLFAQMSLFGQSADLTNIHYYYEGQQIELPMDLQHFSVKFKRPMSLKEQENFLKSQGFTLERTEKLPSPDLTIVRFGERVDAATLQQRLAALQQQPEVAYVAAFYNYRGVLQTLTNRLLVKLHTASDLGLLQAQARQHGATIDFEASLMDLVYVLETKDGETALDLANTLYKMGAFAYAEPDFIKFIKPTTSDPLFPTQWSLQNLGSSTYPSGTAGADMKVTAAWGVTTGSANVKVAILDEGVDIYHPDLVNNLLAGFDATGLGSAGHVSGDDAHGTACAGIVAAQANNNIGMSGVAYNSKIIPVRIAYSDAAGDWVTSNTWIGNAITWAWQTAGADILSNSWGGGSPSSAITNAFNNAFSQGRNGLGAVILCAAGNEDTAVIYPATLDNVISVAASSMCDQRKSTTSCDGETFWGSCYGTGLDVAAPGVKIVATDISGTAGYSSGNYTSTFNGTSSATPNAAGVVALILSANSSLTATQARFALESTCDKVGGYTYSNVAGQPNGTWTQELGYGRVNAYNAVQLAIGGTISYCTGTTTLVSESGSFSDGSAANNYSNGADCKWLIQPTGAATVTLTFTAFATQLNNDLVYVYDGSSTSAPLLGTFSGNTLPAAITSTGGSMLVHFVSNNSVTAAGWEANYTSPTPGSTVYCNTTTTLTNNSGTITDGSGSNDYGNYSDCQWLINVAGASSISLNFTAFDTESGYDFVKIYNGNSTAAPLLGSFSGTTIPAGILASGNQVLIHFTSDHIIVASGWSLNYTASFPGPVDTTGYVVGTYGSVNGNTTPSPINIYYRSLRYQTVYTAAELLSAGMVEGDITALGWNVTEAPLYALPNYKVSMKNTTATSAAIHDGTGLTQVFQATSYSPTSGNFDMLTFQTPFAWDGVSNILIDVCFDQVSPTYNSSGRVVIYSATNGARFVRSDSSPQCGITTSTPQNNKPQVKLRLTPTVIDPCLGFNLVATSVGNVSVAGANDGFIVLNAGVSNVTYVWQDAPTLNTNSRYNLAAGTYSVTAILNGTTCSQTLNIDVCINSLTVGTAMTVCVNGGIVNLTSNPSGGTWSGAGIVNADAGIFDPTVSGVGVHLLTYIYGAGTCLRTATQTITVISGGTTCLPDFCPVQWTNLTAVNILNSGLTLRKNNSAGWNSGARSINKLAAGTNGWVEMEALETSKRRVLGLATLNTSSNQIINYAILLDRNGVLSILENGTNKGNFGTYSTGDKLQIERIGTTVFYSKNNSTFYTSTVASTTDLYVDCSLQTLNATIHNVIASFGCTIPDPCADYTVSISALGDATCSGDEDGFIDVLPNMPNPTYTWSDGGTDYFGSRFDLPAGSYQLIAAWQGTSCYDTLLFEIETLLDLTLALDSVQNESCLAENDGKIFVSSNTTGLTYYWNNGTNNSNGTLSGLSAGSYSVLAVHDNTGCEADLTAQVLTENVCPNGGCPVTWATLVNATISNATMTKTSSATSWTDGGRSTEILNASADGWMETTILETNKRRVIGLAILSRTIRRNIDYGIYFLEDGKYQIYEQAVTKTSKKTYNAGDVFRISRDAGVVRYYRNGTLVYTSTATSNTALYATTSLFSAAATAHKVRASFACPNILANSTLDNMNTEELRSDADATGEVLLYPNPTAADFTLDYRNFGQEIRTIELFSLNGQRLQQVSVSASGISRIATDALPAGIYVVAINGQKSLKVVKL